MVVVEVEWTDAASYASATVPLTDKLPLSKHCQLVENRHTVGYLLYEDEKRTVLGADYDPPSDDEPSGSAGNITVIPTPWVTSKKVIA